MKCKTPLFNVIVAILYAVTAFLGLKLAVPPGYATGIWAPSGIALGALLVWGLRVIPGIFIGSFLANLYIAYFNFSHISTSVSYTVAAYIAIGATVQALLGWRLIKAFVGLDNLLESPKDILRFALLSGPISCLFNATWSSLGLYALGQISFVQVGMNWAVWWVGDTTGALVITPLFLILFAQPRAYWRARFFQHFIPLVVTFSLVIGLFVVISSAELNRVKDKFYAMTVAQVKEINAELHYLRLLSALTTTHSVGDMSSNKKSLNHSLQEILKRAPFLEGIAWLPANITHHHDQLGIRLHSSIPRDMRFFSKKGESELVNKHLFSAKAAIRAMKAAYTGGRAVFYSPFLGVDSQNSFKTMFLFSPVYKGKEFAGFSVMQFNLKNFLSNLFQGNQNYSSVELLSQAKDKMGTLSVIKKTSNVVSSDQYQLEFEQSIRIDSYSFLLVAKASQAYLDNNYSWKIWIELVFGLVFCAVMNIVLFILYGQKSTIQKKLKKQAAMLRAIEAKNLLILNSAGEGILGLDQSGRVTFANPAAVKLFGCSETQLQDSFLHERIKHDVLQEKTDMVDEPLFYKTIREGKIYHDSDAFFIKENGAIFAGEYTSTPMKNDDQITGAVVTFSDVTDRRQSEAELDRMARLDLLTALPNRFSFMETLERAISRSERNDQLMAVCFFDIDGFKGINDTMGHMVGDKFLAAIPQLIFPSLRSMDYMARLGGDEFGLIFEKITSVDQVRTIVARCIQSINQEIYIDNNKIRPSISLGVALYPAAGESAEELLKNADLAMYRSKSKGKNTFTFFDDDINKTVHRRHGIDSGIRTAIQNNELSLVYQPQISVKTGKLVGVEVLLRWDNQLIPTVGPGEFIPISEESGVIQEIGFWVIQSAFKSYNQLLAVQPGLKISINLSVRQLESDGFVELISTALSKYQVDPKDIFFEVTETALMKHIHLVESVMARLSSIGFRFALDDFGVGHSSLSYLKKMSISMIKIDRSFVRDIVSDSNDAAIVKATIQLSQGLGIQTVAEGVETAAQLAFLKQHECDFIQGYYFAQPMTLENLQYWIAPGQTGVSSDQIK